VEARLVLGHRRHDRPLLEGHEPEHQRDADHARDGAPRPVDAKAGRGSGQRERAAAVAEYGEGAERAADDRRKGVEVTAEVREGDGGEDEGEAGKRSDPDRKSPPFNDFTDFDERRTARRGRGARGERVRPRRR
jgi:hypothetical protein